MQLPAEPLPGQLINAAWAVQVVRYLRAITPRSGSGVDVIQGTNGTTFRASSGSYVAPYQKPPPFTLLDASDQDGTKIRVTYGTVNANVPEGFSNGDKPIFTIEVGDSSGVIYLRVDTDAEGVIKRVQVNSDTQMPKDGTDDSGNDPNNGAQNKFSGQGAAGGDVSGSDASGGDNAGGDGNGGDDAGGAYTYGDTSDNSIGGDWSPVSDYSGDAGGDSSGGDSGGGDSSGGQNNASGSAGTGVTSPPYTPQQTLTIYYQQIGSYNLTDNNLSIAQAISGSQWFELCGGVTPLWGVV